GPRPSGFATRSCAPSHRRPPTAVTETCAGTAAAELDCSSRLPVRDVFDDESVQHAVDPLVVAPVRLAAHTLVDEAGALRMPHGPLVEAVDLHLQAVEAELVQEVALELPRRRVGHLRSA